MNAIETLNDSIYSQTRTTGHSPSWISCDADFYLQLVKELSESGDGFSSDHQNSFSGIPLVVNTRPGFGFQIN